MCNIFNSIHYFFSWSFPLYIFLSGSTGSCSFIAAGDATPQGLSIPTLQTSNTSTNYSMWEIISYLETNSEASVGKIFQEQILSRHLLVKLNNDALFISQCFD